MLLAFTILIANLATGDWTSTSELVPLVPVTDSFFGSVVDQSGNTAVVTAYTGTEGGVETGTAYVFERPSFDENFVEKKKLFPSDGSNGAEFGRSATIDNDTMAIGAPYFFNAGGYDGRVYIYSRDESGTGEWGLATSLNGSIDNNFGVQVSLYDSTLAVGTRRGVELFGRDICGEESWCSFKKIYPPISAEDFGLAVSLHMDTLAVGAPSTDTFGLSSGSAYVFEKDHNGSDTWGQSAQLKVPTLQPLDSFGISIAIYGDVAVVGANGVNVSGFSRSGEAYLFNRTTEETTPWGLYRTLGDPSPRSSSSFGRSVSVSENHIMVGGDLDGEFSLLGGAILAFERNKGGADNWGFTQKIPPPTDSSQFGVSCSVESGSALIGAGHNAYAYSNNPTAGTTSSSSSSAAASLDIAISFLF